MNVPHITAIAVSHLLTPGSATGAAGCSFI
jgi:hypothetical protein